MTVDTPFPERPATPYWDPRGVFASGNWGSGLPQDLGAPGIGSLGDQQTTVRVLDAITAGSMAAERSLVNPYGYAGACPVGTVLNPTMGVCQPGGTVTASASSGVLILAAIGVALFFMSRGR